MYKKNILKEYIEKSELRIFSDNIKVRLSKELAAKYDAGIYKNYLENTQLCFNQINSLNIKYPGNAKPILYIYIVPDDNYSELLKIPPKFDSGKGGGKPVKCYDLDGFNSAYGLSQNLLENYTHNKLTIQRIENEIHELSHIIHSQFSPSTNLSICEGIAETIPLYILDYEEKFEEHKNIIKNLNENQILSIKELLDSEQDGTYGKDIALQNSTCSFRYSYISSYLFIRACVERIKTKNNITKKEALQRFLEIVKDSSCKNEWLVYDIANSIGISQDELLHEKKLQINIINTI